MSPELIAPQRFGLESSRPTQSSDCYAFGMVIYETISGHLPFHRHADLTVFVKVLEGERPLREVGFVDGLWVCGRCWNCVGHLNRKPARAPNMSFAVWRGSHSLEARILLSLMKEWIRVVTGIRRAILPHHQCTTSSRESSLTSHRYSSS